MSNNKEDVRTLLFLAVSCGNLETVEELVGRHGVSYLANFCGGYELLFNASFCGYKKIVRYLLDKGANVNNATNHADTPLHFAAWFGDSELTQLLLDHKALIDAKDKQYETPLHVACQRGYENVVALLVNRGANLDAIRQCPATYREKFGHVKIAKVAFAAACQIGHEGFKEILNFGAQIDNSNDQKPSNLSFKNYRTRVCQDVPRSDSQKLQNLIFEEDRKRAALRKRESEDSSFENYCTKKVCLNTESEGNVTPLHIAVEMRLLKIVKLLLNKGAFVNAQTDQHSTPLLLATKHGYTDVARILLEHGACVNMKDNKNSSPLYFALEARNWHLVSHFLQLKPEIDGKIRKLVLDIIAHDDYTWSIIVDDFIDNGFFSNLKDVDYSNLLQSAIRQGYTNLVRYISNRGMNVGVANIGFAPLHLAVENGHKDIIVLLLDAGCKINSKDKLGKTPLSYSLNRSQKSAELIQLLLNRGADLKAAPGLLHKAISQMNIQVCKILLESGANAQNGSSVTPLHHATSVLLGLECNPNIKDGFGETAISNFRRSNWKNKCTEIIQLLLDFGADVKEAPDLLNVAVCMQNIEVCKILVKNGANVNRLDEKGMTPLHRAASERYRFFDHSELKPKKEDNTFFLNARAEKAREFKRMVARGLNSRRYTSSDCSKPEAEKKVTKFCSDKEPVFFNSAVASTSRHRDPSEMYHSFEQSEPEVGKEITKFLLDNGADSTIKIEYGFTALHLGILNKREDSVHILLDYKADVNSRANDHSTPLHLACEEGSKEIVRTLLNNGADIEAVMQKGSTPLHLAVLGGHSDVVKMLLNSNVDVNAQRVSNETALHCAAMKNDCKIIPILLNNGADVNVENIKGKTAASLALVGDNIRLPKSSIVEDLQQHLIKLNIAGLYISEQNLRLFDRHSVGGPLLAFKRKCTEELNQLKNEWNDGYELLHIFENPEYLSSAQKKALIRNVTASEFGKYPTYESLLKSNFSECQVRLEMITSGRKWLSFLLVTSNALNMNKLPILPTEIIEEIISYLSKRDLNRLICCGKNLKRQFTK